MKRYLLLILLICCGYEISFAAITMQVDPPSIQLSDTFHLTITMDDTQAAGVPDLTVLDRDFVIMGTQRSMSYTIVNGQALSVRQWSIMLRATKTGVIPIPEIPIGQQHSMVTSIEVTEDKAMTTDNDQTDSAENAVMLKTAVSKSQPYVNQQVIYTVKLYNSQRLLDADYQPPSVTDALLIPLGDGRRYQTNENGRTYAVEEQQYAFFPQKSGELQIVAPSFSALAYDATPRRVRIQGETIKLNVQPMPANYSGQHWLPAKQVALKDDYDKSGTNVLQGSTLVRTITLQATGMPAQLLPTLTFAPGKEFNVYPEKADENNRVSQQELIGTTTIKVTYLLNKPGQVTIPELQVPWFNTETGKEEVAALPPLTIMVDAKGEPSSQTTSVPPSGKKTADSTAPAPGSSKVTEDSPSSIGWWLAIGFAAAWLATLTLWWYRPKSFTSGEMRAALKQLKEACTENNPAYAQEAILRWAVSQWPDAQLLNMDDVARFVQDPQLKKQLLLLTQVLYSQDKHVYWRGHELWRRIVAYRHIQPNSQIKPRDLPPINPI